MMQRLTPVVKNLLIINIVVFLAQGLTNDRITEFISLWKFESENFKPYQFFTYMFAHGDFFHILFNMLGLIFLGPLLEQFWGSKRFVTFYLVTGLGAAAIYSGIEYIRMDNIKDDVEMYVIDPGPQEFNILVLDHFDELAMANPQIYDFINEYDEQPQSSEHINMSKAYAKQLYTLTINSGPMLGASGAIYGILMAFGLLFPNTQLMLLFPPIPIKAKYLVLGLGLIALYSGLQRSPGDNVAHFAHLGGMVFAFILIKYWQSRRDRFY